jgi:hypothetical protein
MPALGEYVCHVGSEKSATARHNALHSSILLPSQDVHGRSLMVARSVA